MRPRKAAPGGDRDAADTLTGNARIVSVRPQARIVQSLRAVGLRVELRRIGHHIVPIVSTGRSPT